MITSALGSEIDGALQSLEDDLYIPAEDVGYETFLWMNASIRCVSNMSGSSSALVFGGHEEVTDLSLNVRLSQFLTADSTLVTVDTELFTADNDTPRPIAGMILKFRGKNYRITSAAVDSSRVYVKLVLGDFDSGR